jgi:hypothetical protein
MRRTGTGSGGGTGMNKIKQVGVNVGPRSTEKISPCAANQLGTKLGNAQAIDPLVMGTMKQVPLGNEVAKNVGTGGPGKGREIIGKSGTQGHH